MGISLQKHDFSNLAYIWDCLKAASSCGIEPRIKCQRLHLILKHIFQDAKMSKKWKIRSLEYNFTPEDIIAL